MKLGRLSETTIQSEEPNVGPLIDIVFILLIFFVVTTTFSKDLGMELSRPQASTGDEQQSSIVRVAMGRRGELSVNGRAVSLWRLEAEVRERLTHYLDKSVLLISDEGVDVKALVETMDLCRRAGAAQVALAVEPALP